MISFPSLTRVWVWGSSAWGAAGSGICFTQTTTFMASIVPENGPSDQSAPVAPGAPEAAGGRTCQVRPRWARVSATESVITTSTPASTTASRSSGLFTVQVTMARPRAWASSTSRALTRE